MTKRNTYTKAFKTEAVRQLEAGDMPAEQLARELGVRRNSLYKWQKELQLKGDAAFSNKRGPKPPADAELARLKAENERLQEEVEILKKAAVDSTGQRNSYYLSPFCCRLKYETNLYSRRTRTSI